MKTSLKFIALLIAAGTPVAALAQFAGAHLPAALNTQNIAGAFTVVFVALLLLKDYSASRPSLVATHAPVIVPPAHAFQPCADRLAA